MCNLYVKKLIRVIEHRNTMIIDLFIIIIDLVIDSCFVINFSILIITSIFDH